MKIFETILVALDGSTAAARSLGVASWLAAHLEARLHVLNAGEALPEGEALAQLHVPEKYRHLIELHQVGGEASTEILGAIARYRIGLVVMTTHGESGAPAVSDPLKIVGHVTREVIEQSHTPVLMLPPAYEESLPWRSALVPLSGEMATDESLTLALHLAHALDLSVTVAHVAAVGVTAEPAGAGIYADAVHHELPQRLNELVAGACPMCSAEERRRIENFHVARGDIAQELLSLIEQKRASLLVVGWRGQFMQGHAQVLKTLIQRIRCPVLLVRPAPKPAFRLKVGEALAQSE